MPSQNSYMQEVIERCDKTLSVKCMAEVEPLSDVAKAAAEAAYRRGYFQGFFAANEAASDCISESKRHDFIYADLFAWRYEQHSGAFKEPPTCK